MPIVTVQMFSGRNDIQKEFVVRGIADVVSETCGVSREGIHVIFDERERSDWAIGPRLASHREGGAPESDPAAVVQVSRIHIQSEKHDDYLAWRRDAVYPYMGRHEGFISSTLLTVPGEKDQYYIINKWRDQASYDAYLENPKEEDLRAQAKNYVSELASEELNGTVVDVFSR